MAAPAAPPTEHEQLLSGAVVADERAARATLRTQLRHLERELAQLASDRFADPGDRRPIAPPPGARRPAAPRLSSFAELESQRDALVARVAAAREQRIARRAEIRAARLLLGDVRRAPERHPYARIRLAELGEPGCGAYVVKPRLGIIGMLAGWWHVKLSSGCP
jgi:hypothetical protein